jgi:hypothetical protein
LRPAADLAIFSNLGTIQPASLLKGDLMIFGMTTFTFVHVLLSLIGIFSGFVVVFGMLAAKHLDGWTALFLVTTVLTSVTGFLFPFHKFLPSHGVGIVSCIVLAFALLGRYAFHLAGAWRRIYVITAVIALYLNVFVLIAQLFQKVPHLADQYGLCASHSGVLNRSN